MYLRQYVPETVFSRGRKKHAVCFLGRRKLSMACEGSEAWVSGQRQRADLTQPPLPCSAAELAPVRGTISTTPSAAVR